MKCIIGLGNPGKRYKKTRHNIGFMVIDELLKDLNISSLNKSKFNNDYTIETINEKKVMLVKPQSFMNLSGEAVRPLIDYYEININDVLVLYDDLDLPAGKIRLRQKGGHGGHNGIRSLIQHLDTKDFKRIRLGIGRPTDTRPIVDYVLQSFMKEEIEKVNNSIIQSVNACKYWFEHPFDDVMNRFN